MRLFKKPILHVAVIYFALLILNAAVASPSSLHEKVEDGALAKEANSIMHTMHQSNYQHHMDVSRSNGIYDLDCSQFVDYLVKHIAPLHYELIPVESHHSRPRAIMYYNFFDSLDRAPASGWQRIHKLSNTKAGDILAWMRDDFLIDSRGDTGHVMIVASSPTKNADGSYTVEVYDSTATHHDNDTRVNGASGIGKGSLVIYVDLQDSPVAYRFNSQSKKRTCPIRIGRMVDI